MSHESTPAQVQPRTPSHPIVLPTSCSTSTSIIFTTHEGNGIDDAILDRCAKNFSANYGVWGHGIHFTVGRVGWVTQLVVSLRTPIS